MPPLARQLLLSRGVWPAAAAPEAGGASGAAAGARAWRRRGRRLPRVPLGRPWPAQRDTGTDGAAVAKQSVEVSPACRNVRYVVFDVAFEYANASANRPTPRRSRRPPPRGQVCP